MERQSNLGARPSWPPGRATRPRSQVQPTHHATMVKSRDASAHFRVDANVAKPGSEFATLQVLPGGGCDLHLS